VKYLIMIIGLLSVGNSVADTDAVTEDEKRYLIKIVQDLKHLDEMAAKASVEADPDARVTLDYVALRHDLQEMQRALETHITTPSRSPRKMDALSLARKN
jgi:RAQPRD family integrative conjugative element protein